MSEEQLELPLELSAIFGITEEKAEVKPVEEEKPAEEVTVAEEKEEKEEKKDVNWEKRHKDTYKAFQEARTENNQLTKKLEVQAKSLEEMQKRVDRHGKELFPDEEAPVKKPEDVVKERWQTKVADAEALTRTVYKDYDEKVGKEGDVDAPFLKAVKESPSLWTRVKGAKNPALEAYNIAKEYEFSLTYGRTPEEIETKMREKILKELEEKKDVKPVKSKLPTTLRAVEAASSSSTNELDEMKLSAIFKGR